MFEKSILPPKNSIFLKTSLYNLFYLYLKCSEKCIELKHTKNLDLQETLD